MMRTKRLPSPGRTGVGIQSRWGVAAGWMLCFWLGYANALALPAPPVKAGSAFELINSGIVVTVPTHEGELRLLLDTGSSLVIITQQAQLALHLTMRPTGLQAGEIHFLGAEVTDVHLGTVVLRRLAVFTSDNPAGNMMDAWNKQHPEARIDGLLGLPALRDLAFGIDMREHRILFWNHGELSAQTAARFLTPDPKNTRSSELHTVACQVNESGLHVPVKIGGVTTSLTLDTGSAQNVAGSRLTPYLHPVTTGFKTNMERVFGMETSNLYAVSSLNVDGEVFACPWITVYEKLDRKLDCGILGLDLFQDCRFIIDLPGQKLLFVREKTAETAAHEKLFQSGLASLNIQGRFLAFPCLETAQNTGMQPQDMVLQIDHRPVDKILDWKSTGDVTLTYLKVSADATTRRELIVSRSALHSPLPRAAPEGEAFVLLPNEKVIYRFPYGALYIPASYKGVVDRTGKGIYFPTPTGGYLLPNLGPAHTAAYTRMKPTLVLDNSGVIYTQPPDRPVEIQPGYYWAERLEDENRGAFFIAAPLKAPIDAKDEFGSK